MVHGFATDDPDAALAALIVYTLWRARNPARRKITPEVWAQNERFVKSAAKRAENLWRFIEVLKPRFGCDTLRPAVVAAATGDTRQQLTTLIERADHQRVLDLLYRETAWIVLLVRDCLERERSRPQLVSAALPPIVEEED